MADPLPPADPDIPAAELLAVAHAVADAAAPAALHHFRAGGAVEDKGAADAFDPVTEADRDAERAMRETLARLRPHDAILGEEEAAQPGTSGLTWVLDPIDGTRAFISGMPTWGVLVACDAGAGPILGIVDQPFTGERFAGGPAGATFRRGAGSGAPMRVRDTHRLEDATLFTTFPEIGTPAERAAFEAVRDRARLTRYGADCYAYALLALGQIDLVVEAGLQPFDIQAPMAVIEAAGGIVTDWRGGPAHRGGRVVAAATPALHAEALEHLARAVV